MNGTVSYRLAESYDEVIQYLSVILDATLIGISKNNPPEPPIQINEDILVDMKSWMDVLFRYQNISYTFEMIDSPSIQVSKSIFQSVACLLSFHVPGNIKVIQIEEKNGGLEIS